MVAGNITDVIIDINGYYAAPTDGVSNTAIGAGTLASITTGQAIRPAASKRCRATPPETSNTASGAFALQNNTAGGSNTASGDYALQNNTTGSNNTASGYAALQSNTTGSSNTASGSQALEKNTAGDGQHCQRFRRAAARTPTGATTLPAAIRRW